MDVPCHTIFPKNPPVQKITLWNSREDVIDFFFVGKDYTEEVKEETKNLESGKEYKEGVLKEAFGLGSIQKMKKSKRVRVVFEPFFQDDTIRSILLKLVVFLELPKDKLLPYIWNEEGSLRFRLVKTPWDGYHVNPFLSSPNVKSPIPEVQQLPDKVFPILKDLHITTHSAVSSFLAKPQQLRYYFPNDKDIYKEAEIQTALYEQQMLQQLWYKPEGQHRALIQQTSCSYLRAVFTASLKKADMVGRGFYKPLFEKLHTSQLIPFIQLYDDMNHIYYKVKKDHKIPEDLFQEWTNMANFTNTHSITFYSFLKEGSQSFSKVFMEEDGKVRITYRLEGSENIGYDKIYSHLKNIIEELYRLWKIKLRPEVERLALKTNIYMRDIQLKTLSASFAKYPQVFHVPSKNRVKRNILDLQYKRVSKYGETRNIVEFIKSKIELEVPVVEIIQELQEYGIDEEEVRNMFEEIQREGELPKEKQKKRNLKNLGLLMHLNPIALGLQIYIDNASNFTEMQNALFWTRATVLEWANNLPKKRTPPTIEERKQARAQAEAEAEEEEVMIRPPSGTSTATTSSTDSRPLSLGGAIGKKYQRLFKKLLEDTDPDVFARTENYARKCQVTDLRQPIVMTKEQKKKIDEMGYSDGYDDFIEYGSDPNNTQVYMCPKIYCPNDQIPLSYEKFVANGEKCPNPDDEPILLYTTNYWYNDPARKHYIGFLTEKGYNNLSLPCCFKLPKLAKIKKEAEKEQKKKKVEEKEKSRKETDVEEKKQKPRAEAEAEVEVEEKKPRVEAEAEVEVEEKKPRVEVEGEEAYIIDRPKQLESGRFGTIPPSLHKFLYDGIPYTLCKNTVKTEECVLRRGVGKEKDSLMTSIAYLLDFENKERLIEDIYRRLDPFTFLTLENGQVYTYFLSDKVILPEENLGKRKELKSWLEKNQAYASRFLLGDILPYLSREAIEDAPLAIRYKIARQLQIYDSYYKFLQYLKSDEPKNPFLLFDLVHFLGALMVVWNRDNQSIATIRCPFATKNKQWFLGQDKEVPYVLVMQQEDYYEPLVIAYGDSSKKITQKVAFSKFSKLFDLIGKCPVMLLQEDDVVHRIYTLSLWIDTILSDSSHFRLDTIVLDPQDRTIGCFLRNKVFITFPKPISMFSMLSMVDNCKIPHVAYWEDIQHKSFDIHVPLDDLLLLKTKLEKLGFGYQLGTVREQGDRNIKTLYTVPAVVYPEPPKLPVVLKDTFIQAGDIIEQDNRKWYKTKKTILEKLLRDYERLELGTAKWNEEGREAQLRRLRKLFDYLQQPSRVAVILEEIPYLRKDLLQKMYDEMLLDKPYYSRDNRVFEGHRKKEWIFTQKAVERMDIGYIRRPTRIQRPRGEPNTEKEVLQNIQLPEKEGLPPLLQSGTLDIKPIPTKWRTQFWSNYSIGMSKNYKKDTLLEVVQWIARQRGIYLDVDDLQLFLRKQVYLMLENPELYEVILDDLSMRKAWNRVLGRQYRTIKETIQLGFQNKTVKELQRLWLEASKTSELWPQDMDLYQISRLVGVSFLLLKKGKDVLVARGNIDERLASSQFITALPKGEWMYHPVMVLYKTKSADNSHTEYGMVISKDTNGYYSQGMLLPKEMLKMVEKHRS